MFHDVVTIYNKYREAGKERWQRHIITGVNWTDIQGAVARKSGVAAVNSFMLIIPAAELSGYKTPRDFAACESKADSWTVAPQDTVVLGALDVEIATTPGKDLAACDNVRTVTAVDSYLHGALANLEVSGK